MCMMCLEWQKKFNKLGHLGQKIAAAAAAAAARLYRLKATLQHPETFSLAYCVALLYLSAYCSVAYLPKVSFFLVIYGLLYL